MRPAIRGLHFAPSIVSILVGEAVYNLRAALDYLVYELAWLDSGQIQDDTQFPIENSPKVFQGRSTGFYFAAKPGKKPKRRSCGRYLAGVNSVHCGWLEQLQPYKGCDWTKTLGTISNPDKHRKLTTTDVVIGTQHRPIDPPRETGAGTMVNMEFRYSPFVGINGIPIEEVLRELQAEVGNVLALFDPEFEG